MTNDIISRQDALRPFCINSKGERIPERDCDNWQVQIPIADVKKILREVPSSEPQERKGMWIQFPSHNAYKCSECGRVIVTTDGKNNVCKHYPYCHCGSRMEVEHELGNS